MHYPAYTIVIYQHLQVLNDVRSAILDRKGKKDGIRRFWLAGRYAVSKG